MPPANDEPALGERDVAANNAGGDAADGIADAEAVSSFDGFPMAPVNPSTAKNRLRSKTHRFSSKFRSTTSRNRSSRP